MKTLTHKTVDLEKILNTIGITDLTYGHKVLECGNIYAAKHCDNTEMFDALTASKVYWKWFTNQFVLIDRALIENSDVPDKEEFLVRKGLDGISKISVYEYWLRLHEPDLLVAFPGREVWKDAEARLMGEVIDETMKGADHA